MYDDYHNQFRNEKIYLNNINYVIISIRIFIQFLKIKIYIYTHTQVRFDWYVIKLKLKNIFFNFVNLLWIS